MAKPKLSLAHKDDAMLELVRKTAHVPTHSIGAANYALQAIHRAASPAERPAALKINLLLWG